AYLELLIAQAEFPDAVKFLAHALPKREAVWWAWFCARRVAAADPPPDIQASLAATAKWILSPNHEKQRAATKAAAKATFGRAAGCAGVAAFMSGGSLGRADVPTAPPGEFLTAKMVAGAIQLAAVETEPEKAPEKYRAFLSQGVEVTRKIGLWDKKG